MIKCQINAVAGESYMVIDKKVIISKNLRSLILSKESDTILAIRNIYTDEVYGRGEYNDWYVEDTGVAQAPYASVDALITGIRDIILSVPDTEGGAGADLTEVNARLDALELLTEGSDEGVEAIIDPAITQELDTGDFNWITVRAQQPNETADVVTLNKILHNSRNKLFVVQPVNGTKIMLDFQGEFLRQKGETFFQTLPESGIIICMVVKPVGLSDYCIILYNTPYE